MRVISVPFLGLVGCAVVVGGIVLGDHRRARIEVRLDRLAGGDRIKRGLSSIGTHLGRELSNGCQRCTADNRGDPQRIGRAWRGVIEAGATERTISEHAGILVVAGSRPSAGRGRCPAARVDYGDNEPLRRIGQPQNAT